MSIILRILQFLNNEIQTIGNVSIRINKMQFQCNVSDSIDKLAIMYAMIMKCINSVRKCFQLQIISCIFVSSTTIVFEVGK